MSLHIGPINAATPTPLKRDGSFDRESAERLCRRWRQIELDGVLLLGSMGEGLLLPDAVRDAFVETALKATKGELTLFISAAARAERDMRDRALRYARMGAACVVLAAPVGATPEETLRQILKLCDACPVACVYYEVPAVTGVTLTFDQIKEVVSHPNIVAVKDSSNNALMAQALTAERRGDNRVKLLDGVEYRTAYSAALGYDGVIHGGGVLTARRVRSIWNSATDGRLSEAMELDRENSLCLGELYNRFSGPVQNIAGQKFALKLMGIFADERAMVDQPLGDSDRHRISKVLSEHRQWLSYRECKTNSVRIGQED